MIPVWGRSHSQGEASQCPRKGNDENDGFKTDQCRQKKTLLGWDKKNWVRRAL